MNVSVMYLYYKYILLMFFLVFWMFNVLLSRSKSWYLVLQIAFQNCLPNWLLSEKYWAFYNIYLIEN